MTVTEVTHPPLVELLRRGMGDAAQALTEMSGRLIRVETLAAYLCAPAELGRFVGEDERGVVVEITVTGPVRGHAALMVGLGDARRLGALLLAGLADDAPDDPDGLGPLQASAISEIANVTIGTLIRCVERATGASLHASVPRLVIGAAPPALRDLAPTGGHGASQLLIAITTFADAAREIRGTVLLLPDPAALVSLRTALERC